MKYSIEYIGEEEDGDKVQGDIQKRVREYEKDKARAVYRGVKANTKE